jgi:HK97 family phage portal protein
VTFQDIVKSFFTRKNNSDYQYAQMVNGDIPIFSQFGEDVYASDVVQTCIGIVASELSKLQPKHIRTDNDEMQNVVKGSLNRLFKFSPNELMTTRDFIEKIIWQLFLNKNAFIYPMYDILDKNGIKRREYTSLYPLNPRQVEFLQDTTGKLFIKFIFKNGRDYTLPYSDVIHLRKDFSLNEIMGGDANGQPDNAGILKALQINDTALQGLDKAIKTSLTIRGIVNIKTMMDDPKQEAERKRFEKAVENSQSGIVALDMKGDYIPLKADPKLLDKDTLKFLQDKILPYYGMSLPIFMGDFTDEQYQAWYERSLESIVISLGQAFSKTLFTKRELEMGNEVVFYQKNMMYLSTKSKLELLKTAGEQGLLTDNQKLSILGYPPIPDGNRRSMSLNYIDVDHITEYQMKKAGKKETEGNSNE